jgi:hypothetical protein
MTRLGERLNRHLTDGYARALTLEAECLRITRRITAVSAGASENGAPQSTELASLSRRLGETRSELANLRADLERVRRRFDPPYA